MNIYLNISIKDSSIRSIIIHHFLFWRFLYRTCFNSRSSCSWDGIVGLLGGVLYRSEDRYLFPLGFVVSWFPCTVKLSSTFALTGVVYFMFSAYPWLIPLFGSLRVRACSNRWESSAWNGGKVTCWVCWYDGCWCEWLFVWFWVGWFMVLI